MKIQYLIISISLSLAIAVSSSYVVAQDNADIAMLNSHIGFLFNAINPGSLAPAPAAETKPVIRNPAGTTNFNFISRYNLVSIDYPGAPRTVGVKINDLEQLVGWYSFTPASEPLGDTPFLFANNRFNTINIPGSVWGEAAGINNKGMVVGSFQDGSGTEHGFWWQIGMAFARQLDFPGADWTGISDNNDAGKIVGAYGGTDGLTHGFLLDSGIFTTLDFPGALDFTSAIGINNKGDIVGEYNDMAGNIHGFSYKNGVYTPIDFPAAKQTAALGNNDQGAVVGWYSDANNKRIGFIRSSTGVFSAFDVPGSKRTILAGINNKGKLIGNVQDSQGELHNLLATPTLLLGTPNP